MCNGVYESGKRALGVADSQIDGLSIICANGI